MKAKKGSLKWVPAMPIVKQDNVISSRAREAGEIGFKPTYEKAYIFFDFLNMLLNVRFQDEENMYFILSNEYLRMWQNERTDYEREVYSKQDTESDSKMIKRRFVQRFVKYPDKGIYLPPLTLKM